LVEEPKSKEESSAPSIDEKIQEEIPLVEEEEVVEGIHIIEDIIHKWVPDRRYSTEEGYKQN